MKVSTRGRYGLRALVDMTIHSNNAPVSLVQVANRQKISLNYLEQVFGTLRKAGIVVSVKGAGGGINWREMQSPLRSKKCWRHWKEPFQS